MTARRTKLRYALTVLAFLLPSAVPLLLFVLGPMIAAAWISLQKWNLLAPMKFVGLDNYAKLLTDPRTGEVFLHTVYYIAGYLPLVYLGGLALALALNTALKGRSLLRGIYFLPVVTSWIVVALVWRWLLNPSTASSTPCWDSSASPAPAGGPTRCGRCPRSSSPPRGRISGSSW